MVTGISYSADVILSLKEYLGVKVIEWNLQVRHIVSKFDSELNPPAVIVRFLHFKVKDRIWGRKYMLKGMTNPKKISPNNFTKKTYESRLGSVGPCSRLGLQDNLV